LRSRFSPSSPTTHAAPGSTEALVRVNERENAVTFNTVTTSMTDVSLAEPCRRPARRGGSGIEALAASHPGTWVAAIACRPAEAGQCAPQPMHRRMRDPGQQKVNLLGGDQLSPCDQ
jgi:hypothetical protein